ncbi:hypothetical protein FSW04_20165 [Baekduia soli]|uniref:Arc family DNA-binding protein n=1 Tax=Baekduia soli TaxID=496014 RepID=A0A5B8U929_9ACTN|nr:hypothetical protein [Baekduia soli]QEC49663.1 hypothetical protein FSW04_20165 [Baekduia soli]
MHTLKTVVPHELHEAIRARARAADRSVSREVLRGLRWYVAATAEDDGAARQPPRAENLDGKTPRHDERYSPR